MQHPPAFVQKKAPATRVCICSVATGLALAAAACSAQRPAAAAHAAVQLAPLTHPKGLTTLGHIQVGGGHKKQSAAPASVAFRAPTTPAAIAYFKKLALQLHRFLWSKNYATQREPNVAMGLAHANLCTAFSKHENNCDSNLAAGCNVEFDPPPLPTTREAQMDIVATCPSAFAWTSTAYRNDRARVVAALQQDPWNVAFVGESLSSDREILLLAPSETHQAFYLLGGTTKPLCEDREFMLGAKRLQCAPPALLDDSAVVLQALSYYGGFLEDASPRLRDTPDVVLAALSTDPRAFIFASARLREDRAFVLQAARANGAVLEFTDPAFLSDLEICLAAVGENWRALKAGLRDEPDFMLEAVKHSYGAFNYAPNSLKSNREFVLAVIKIAGLALQFAALELRADAELVEAAIDQDPFALWAAAAEFQADRRIALAAIARNCEVFRYASATLRSDREFLTAVALRCPVYRNPVVSFGNQPLDTALAHLKPTLQWTRALARSQIELGGGFRVLPDTSSRNLDIEVAAVLKDALNRCLLPKAWRSHPAIVAAIHKRPGSLDAFLDDRIACGDELPPP
jgi:hypothetical protein